LMSRVSRQLGSINNTTRPIDFFYFATKVRIKILKCQREGDA
jgi:hypothetical protein